MKRAWKGMLESKRSIELERIADEMADQFQTRSESIKNRMKEGLLRAHRTGELIEIRDELDELQDSVPTQIRASSESPEKEKEKEKKRWSEYSSDSDSSFDPREVHVRLTYDTGVQSLQEGSHCSGGGQSDADVSGSDADSSPRGPSRKGTSSAWCAWSP